jgi:hypothetical protein
MRQRNRHIPEHHIRQRPGSYSIGNRALQRHVATYDRNRYDLGTGMSRCHQNRMRIIQPRVGIYNQPVHVVPFY